MEELWVKCNGARLKTYLHNKKKYNTSIIFCHGFTGDSSSVFFPKMAKSLAENFMICRFDFRGQGLSEGRFYDISISSELEDLDSVVKYIKEKYEPSHIILLGYSFGAAVGLLYAAKNNLSGFISLSGEGNLIKAIDYEFNSKQLSEIEQNGETEVFNWGARRKDKLGKQFLEDMRKYSTPEAAKALRASKTPVIMFHGTVDKVIPYIASEEIANILGLTLKSVDGASHSYNFISNPKLIDQVIESLKQWITKEILDKKST
jgi:uncharacterized protein